MKTPYVRLQDGGGGALGDEISGHTEPSEASRGLFDAPEPGQVRWMGVVRGEAARAAKVEPPAVRRSADEDGVLQGKGGGGGRQNAVPGL